MSFLNRLTKQKANPESRRSGANKRRVETSLIEQTGDYNRNGEHIFQPVDLRLLNLKPVIKSVKFPVDGLDCPTTCHAIQHYFKGLNGIESVIANCSMDYFFVTYRTREIRLQEIIDYLLDWGVKSNIRLIYYPVTVTANPMALMPLTQRLLACRSLLDLEWNVGLTCVTLYLNPDYIGQAETKNCIDEIVSEELMKIRNDYEKHDN